MQKQWRPKNLPNRLHVTAAAHLFLRGRGLLLRALLLREDETRPQDRPCEAASCARARPRRLPTRGRAVRPREATTARRAGSPRLPTRGRVVRPREAARACPREAAPCARARPRRVAARAHARPRRAPARGRDGSPRRVAARAYLSRVAACLLRVACLPPAPANPQRPSSRRPASVATRSRAKGRERKDKGHSGLLFLFSQSFFGPKCFTN
jgi:hypothetical protein